MTDEVQFDEAGEIYTVHQEKGYSSEIVLLVMNLYFLDTVKKAKIFLVCLCVCLLLVSAFLIFQFSGFFGHKIVADQNVIDQMIKSAPFQNKTAN